MERSTLISGLQRTLEDRLFSQLLLSAARFLLALVLEFRYEPVQLLFVFVFLAAGLGWEPVLAVGFQMPALSDVDRLDDVHEQQLRLLFVLGVLEDVVDELVFVLDLALREREVLVGSGSVVDF